MFRNSISFLIILLTDAFIIRLNILETNFVLTATTRLNFKKQLFMYSFAKNIRCTSADVT